VNDLKYHHTIWLIAVVAICIFGASVAIFMTTKGWWCGSIIVVIIAAGALPSFISGKSDSES